MKKFNFVKHLLVFVLIIGITSCDDLFKDDDNQPELEYLVDYEVERSYIPVIVKAVFNELVADYPGMENVKNRVEYGVTVYRISYKTTYNGEPVIASGLVSAPMSDGTFPVLSYQNGTNTLHNNAPSVNPENKLYALLNLVASTGFVVTLPDYLGFGESDDMYHPYLHANSTVPAVLDMLRAAEELGELRKHRLSKDLYLSGYSMGGWATMHVQKEIEQNLGSEFNLKASAPGAGPYDLPFIYDYILNQETYTRPHFLGYVFNSYTNSGDITTPLSDIFAEPYDEVISTAYDGSLQGDDIDEMLTTDISELFTNDFLTNRSIDPRFESISETLETNSIEAWNVSTPTRLIHSIDDELVPFGVSQKVYEDLIEAGTDPETIELIPIPSYSHTEGIIPAGLVSLQWFFELTAEKEL